MKPLVSAMLVVVSAAACTPRTPEVAPATTAATAVPVAAAPAVQPGDGRVRGIVRVVGSAPVNVQVIVVPAEGESVALAGPLVSEIRRLSGAEVEVWGTDDGRAVMGSRVIEATEYEVISVDGNPVVMGIVERGPRGDLVLRTETGDRVQIDGATDRFREGQKVWIQGPRTVQVQTYGVIRP